MLEMQIAAVCKHLLLLTVRVRSSSEAEAQPETAEFGLHHANALKSS